MTVFLVRYRFDSNWKLLVECFLTCCLSVLNHLARQIVWAYVWLKYMSNLLFVCLWGFFLVLLISMGIHQELFRAPISSCVWRLNFSSSPLSNSIKVLGTVLKAAENVDTHSTIVLVSYCIYFFVFLQIVFFFYYYTVVLKDELGR